MFGFPYEPYAEQKQLMEALHECIATQSVGCFESPTGTGKSLSSICAAMHWLHSEEERMISELKTRMKNHREGNKSSSSSNAAHDWFLEILQPAAAAVEDASDRRPEELLDAYRSVLQRIADSKSKKNNPAFQFNARGISTTTTAAAGEELFDDFQLPHYDSGDDRPSISYDDDDDDPAAEADSMEQLFSELHLPQIYYCSRTHSQIAQFVAELRKTPYCNTRCITLGSRSNLCINMEVRRRGRTERQITADCVEMQKKKASTSAGAIDSLTHPAALAKKSKPLHVKGKKTTKTKCSYHRLQQEQQFADRALLEVHDIEEMVKLGHQLEACPYYGIRHAIAYAQMVAMPYSLLLHQEMRESTGLRLKHAVVIIDEAHNLIDAINQLHSAQMTSAQLDAVQGAIVRYLRRFQTLLTGKNLYYLQLLSTVLKKLKKSGISSRDSTCRCWTVNDFLFHVGLDNVNFLKLKRHMQETNLINRVGGYAESVLLKERQESVTIHDHSRMTQQYHIDITYALRSCFEFLQCLVHADTVGRIFFRSIPVEEVVTPDANVSSVRITNLWSYQYVMLDPATPFQKLLAEARSVVLLGGTMQPFSYFTGGLFPALPRHRLRLFACGHVVPAAQVRALVLSHGTYSPTAKDMSQPAIVPMHFTFDRRLSTEIIATLFQQLKSICGIVPEGVVVFFTSYNYMNAVINRWRQAGLLKQLNDIKPVFIEARGTSSEGGGISSKKMEEDQSGDPSSAEAWEKYQRAIRHDQSRGAVLCSVMGGKLSEGINFSDELARCVIVVGLPFPDRNDPILQEKMRFANEREVQMQKESTNSTSKSVSDAPGRELCEDMCMKSVNQSIGRAIRHMKDFAAIVLIDHRYSQSRVQGKLPGWIRRNISLCSSTPQLQQQLNEFYNSQQFPS